MTLLQQIHEQRQQAREHARQEALVRLHDALRQLLPGEHVLVFGSVTRPGRFRMRSDIDIGLLAEPRHFSLFRLQAELEERMRRRVDVLLLSECRFRSKIEREGEVWIN